ncbi:hypothetical protein D3C85_15770 [compost metagenome]
MNNNLATGIGVVAVAVLGGIGWKVWSDRAAKKASTAAIASALKNTPPAQKKTVTDKLFNTAPPVKKTEPAVPVVTSNIPDEGVVELEAATVANNKAVEDIVSTLKTADEEVHSVSRVRVPEASGNRPGFWDAGIRKIRRTDIIKLDTSDFLNSRHDQARGFHLCEFEGVSGILHVTKSNFSVVVLDDSGEFHGISTSASKFGGRQLCNITHERAKVFLNGN